MVAKLNDKTTKTGTCSLNFVLVLYQKMGIITLSEALLQKLPPKDGLIIRDRILRGFCLKVGKLSRTFLVATNCNGQQIRITLGQWPSVEEARTLAAPIADIFIACVDGPKGFPEAIEAVYPKTAVQLCIVHLVRYSLNYVSWKLRKVVAADLRAIYAAATVAEAETRLMEFDEKWGKDYPSIVQSWRRNWERIIPFFDYPPEIRKVIYTTNAIESVNISPHKITKNRGAFPSD